MTALTLSQLAIVVVSCGSTALLEGTLAPLSRRQSDLTVVVVDNSADDVERARLVATAAREGWHTVLPQGDTGFGGGMNRGVLKAEQLGARLLLLLNPAVEIAEAALRLLLQTSAEHPDALLSPQILRPDGSVWLSGSDLYLGDGRIRSARHRVDANLATVEPWLSGACLLVTRELWRRTGGFDEQYFSFWEDVDFCHRVASTGGTVRVVSEAVAVAVHSDAGAQQVGGYSPPGAAKSNAYYYYNVRNRLLFAVRHLDDEALRRWSALTPNVAWEVLLQGGRRQFTRSLSPLGAAYRGARDGRRMVRHELRARRRRARELGRDLLAR